MLKPPSPMTRSISNSRRLKPGPSAFGALLLRARTLAECVAAIGAATGCGDGALNRVFSSSSIRLPGALERAVEQAYECRSVRQSSMHYYCGRRDSLEARPPETRAAQLTQQERRRRV